MKWPYSVQTFVLCVPLQNFLQMCSVTCICMTACLILASLGKYKPCKSRHLACLLTGPRDQSQDLRRRAFDVHVSHDWKNGRSRLPIHGEPFLQVRVEQSGSSPVTTSLIKAPTGEWGVWWELAMALSSVLWGLLRRTQRRTVSAGALCRYGTSRLFKASCLRGSLRERACSLCLPPPCCRGTTGSE